MKNSLTHWLGFQAYDLSVIRNTFSEESAFFKSFKILKRFSLCKCH